MDLKKLFQNDDSRAVSPVIGVILMVAITVILAAVIGAFVIGIGDDQEAVPQATFDWSQDSSEDSVTLTHQGGEDLEASEITFEDTEDTDSILDGEDGSDWADGTSDEDRITAGNNITFDQSSDTSGEISIIWTSSTGGSSQVLNSFEYDVS